MCSYLETDQQILNNIRQFDKTIDFFYYCNNCEVKIDHKVVFNEKTENRIMYEIGSRYELYYKIILNCPICEKLIQRDFFCVEEIIEGETTALYVSKNEEFCINRDYISSFIEKNLPKYYKMKYDIQLAEALIDPNEMGIIYRIALECLILEFISSKSDIKESEKKAPYKVLDKYLKDDYILNNLSKLGFYIGNDLSHNNENKWTNVETSQMKNILENLEFYFLNKIQIETGALNKESKK